MRQTKVTVGCALANAARTVAVNVIAVEQAEALPARGDVLETDTAVIPGIQHMLALSAFRACCGGSSGTGGASSSTSSRRSTSSSSSSSSSWSARTRRRGRPFFGGGVGRRIRRASRRRPVKELAALSVAAAARFLEESAHRQPPTRLVREAARVPELALALSLKEEGGDEERKRKQPRSKYTSNNCSLDE